MPAELKLLKNWVMWGGVWNGSKWTKRPIQVSGYGASTTNPKHWSTFEDVKHAYECAIQRGYMELREKDKPVQQIPIGGIGFVFDGKPDKDGLVFAGVDFDKVISADYQQIASLAAERIKRLGSYFEYSVSGYGLHVIVKAHALPAGIAHDGVELYTEGRFFTMTGRAPEDARIVAAPDEFTALAEELRAQSTSSRTSESDPSPRDGEQTLDAEANTWFGKLSSEKQSEVVKYAALHIANNSKMLELGKHGGNYQDYFKLTIAIARSGVPDAENIFVEAASLAKEADPEDVLRKFFQNCEHAQPSNDSVTVGTLLYVASQCSADFNQWKQLADVSGPKVALYAPGNEEECRKLIDRVVAADPRTFTLGDPTGPLAVLRVPDKEALPPGTRWEGDLPGTTLATPADVMQRAERLVWKQRGGGKSQSRLVRTHPPRPFITDYLIQMRGQYGARPLRGIVRVRRIDDSGDVHFVSGYDPATGLFHDRSPTFDVPRKPSRDDARKMAAVLLLPFSKYKFDDPATGWALVLAAIFTAIERPFLSVRRCSSCAARCRPPARARSFADWSAYL